MTFEAGAADGKECSRTTVKQGVTQCRTQEQSPGDAQTVPIHAVLGRLFNV